MTEERVMVKQRRRAALLLVGGEAAKYWLNALRWDLEHTRRLNRWLKNQRRKTKGSGNH